MTGSREARADSSHGGPPPHVFRVLVIEYEVLAELGVEPMFADRVPSSIADALGNLIFKRLAKKEGREVTLTDRGRQLLALKPVSQTEYTVAFDYRVLGWDRDAL